MVGRIRVRVNSVYEREGRDGKKFWSLGVADDMQEGFLRLPVNEGTMVSFSLEPDAWKVVLEAAKAQKTPFVQKVDVNKKKFMSAASDSRRVVVLEIELRAPMVVRPLKDAKRGDAFTEQLSIAGVVKKVLVRDGGRPNSVELE
jgi:hypothetical protein